MNINFSGQYVLTTAGQPDTIHPWESNAELNESVALVEEKAAKKELPVDTLDLGNYVYVFTGKDAESTDLIQLKQALQDYQGAVQKSEAIKIFVDEMNDKKKALNQKKSWSGSDGFGDFLKSQLRQSKLVKKVLSDVKLPKEKQEDLVVFEKTQLEKTHAQVDLYNHLDSLVTELAANLGEEQRFEVSEDFNEAVKKGKFDVESGVMLKKTPIRKLFSRQ